jgi:serpin B
LTDQADFALNLHRVAVPDPRENACWSPFSVAGALALVREGARGQTRAELDALLRDFDPGDALDVPELAVANTLWADDSLTLNPGFSLASSVRRTAFADPATARKLINADVEEATRGLVPELLGRLSPATVAVHAPDGDVQVPTMKVTAELGYARHDGWQTVALPTEDRVEMLVLLPDTSLEQPLEKSVFEVRDTTRVALSLPKVDVSANYELVETLMELGVRTMFAEDADLGGISPDHLIVSEVVHEAVLRVDEQGLEGAAATAVMITRGARTNHRDPIVVTVDRPFLLAVRHARSKAIYFLAQIARP